MSYYVEGTPGRADIIIHMFDEQEQCLYFLYLIDVLGIAIWTIC